MNQQEAAADGEFDVIVCGAGSAGKGLGGGSSINVGVWSRGHRPDWDDFAETCKDLR